MLSAVELAYARIEILKFLNSHDKALEAVTKPDAVPPIFAQNLLSILEAMIERGNESAKKLAPSSVAASILAGFLIARRWLLMRISAQNNEGRLLLSRLAWEELAGFKEGHLETAMREILQWPSLKNYHDLSSSLNSEIVLDEYTNIEDLNL